MSIAGATMDGARSTMAKGAAMHVNMMAKPNGLRHRGSSGFSIFSNATLTLMSCMVPSSWDRSSLYENGRPVKVGRRRSLFSPGALARVRVEEGLADADVLGGDLHELVVADVLDGVLQAHDVRHVERFGHAVALRAHVGELLHLADVHHEVFRLGGLADDHAGVDVHGGAEEELAALLGAEQAVVGGGAVLMGDHGTVRAAFEFAAVFLIPLEQAVHQAE